MAINIEESKNSTFVPDTSLNQPMPMDLSGIKATVDALTKNVSDFVAQYNQAGETKAPVISEPTKTSTIDKLLGKVQQPQKTTADYMAESQQMRNAFLESQGITQEIFNQRNTLATQMGSLNTQLQQMEVQQLKEQDDIRQRTGGTIDLANAEISKLDREYLYKKAMISTQMSGLAGQYQLIQGNIDEANNLFKQSIDYATTKERQEVEDYKWALSFYQDIEESDRRYLQQEYENKQKELEIARDEKWQQLNYQLNLSKIGADSVPVTLSGTEDTFTDTVNYLKQLRDSGKLSDFSYKEQINALMQVGGYAEDQRGQVESMVNQAMQGRTSEKIVPGGVQTTSQVYGTGNFVNASLDAEIKRKQEQNVKMGFQKNTGLREELVKQGGYDVREVDKRLNPLGTIATNVGNFFVNLFGG